jgi:hypothetical protein
MAHFAQLHENNVVVQVIVVANAECLDEHGIERESIGVAFCQMLFGSDTRWVQTSYNGSIRRRYASIGSIYDESCDAFIDPSPFPSWVLNEQTLEWIAPIPYPSDGAKYMWDEDTATWIKIDEVLEAS